MAAIKDVPRGAVLEETTRTRVLSEDEPTKITGDLGFWEYMETLGPNEWQNHIVYVYRWLENGEKEAVGKYAHKFDEFFLREQHGGGAFRLILKKGQQIWKTLERVRVEGPAKMSAAATEARPGDSGESRSMSRLCDLLERVLLKNDNSQVQGEALRSALQLQSEGFRSVVTNVRDITPTAAASPMDEMTKTFLQAAINKMLNPSDPIETFAKMMAAMKGLGFDGGATKASIGAELVRTVGGAIPQIMDGVKSYTTAVTRQAELEMARIAAGQQRPPSAPPAQPQPPPVQHQPAIPPQPPAAAPQQRQPLTMEDVEARIAAMMMNQQLSARDAANDVLDFVQDISPDKLYIYICSLDEVNLTAFINSRAGLNVVPRDPRFAEIIKKIVELAHPNPAQGDPPPNTAPQQTA